MIMRVMNKSLKWVCMLVAVIVTVACGEKKKSAQSAQTEFDYSLERVSRDSTIYGLCGDGSAMNSLQLITDSGDTLLLSTIAAQNNNALLGGYDVGDRMAVIANGSRTQAQIVFNVSTFLGEWVTPNPIDGSSYMGFCVKDGGILESINQSSIIYKTWQLDNGRLRIVSVREGGGDFTEEETYKVLYLTSDSLAMEGAEEVYEYNRPGVMEDYSDIKIDEEGDEYDDIVI